MHEFLPIRYEFTRTDAKWTALSISPREWICSGSNIRLIAAVPSSLTRDGDEVITAIRYDHLPQTHRTHFDAERLNRLKETGVANLKPSEGQPLTVFQCQLGRRREKPVKCVPRVLRDDFWGLKQDDDALLAFLTRHGAWHACFRFSIWSAHPPVDSKPFIVPPGYFWLYQSTLRARVERASQEPATWFESSELPTITRIGEYPFHSCSVPFALDAIETSFSLDLMKQVPKSLCAKEDCRKLFFVTRPDKKYCTEKCARCMVTRRARLPKKS